MSADVQIGFRHKILSNPPPENSSFSGSTLGENSGYLNHNCPSDGEKKALFGPLYLEEWQEVAHPGKKLCTRFVNCNMTHVALPTIGSIYILKCMSTSAVFFFTLSSSHPTGSESIHTKDAQSAHGE